jgi:hypothetical protein
VTNSRYPLIDDVIERTMPVCDGKDFAFFGYGNMR